MAFLIGTILFYMGESINEHFSINSAQLIFFFKGLPIEFFEFNKGGTICRLSIKGTLITFVI